jgi:hypothetical protein
MRGDQEALATAGAPGGPSLLQRKRSAAPHLMDVGVPAHHQRIRVSAMVQTMVTVLRPSPSDGGCSPAANGHSPSPMEADGCSPSPGDNRSTSPGDNSKACHSSPRGSGHRESLQSSNSLPLLNDTRM